MTQQKEDQPAIWKLNKLAVKGAADLMNHIRDYAKETNHVYRTLIHKFKIDSISVVSRYLNIFDIYVDWDEDEFRNWLIDTTREMLDAVNCIMISYGLIWTTINQIDFHFDSSKEELKSIVYYKRRNKFEIKLASE